MKPGGITLTCLPKFDIQTRPEIFFLDYKQILALTNYTPTPAILVLRAIIRNKTNLKEKM